MVAQSDRRQGAEHNWRPIVIDKTAFEDRDGMSYAATNMVHKNLSSRTRQQSEPPLNRNVFPPTPPPDDRSTSNGYSSGSSHHRSSSLRTNARPLRLDLERTGAALDRRPSVPEAAAPLSQASTEKPRIGTTRTASEPRGPASRQQNIRGYSQDPSRSRPHEGHRRNHSDNDFSPSQEYAQADPRDPYSGSKPPSNSSYGRRSRHQPPQYINEEDEYVDEVCDGEPLKDGGFELIGAAPEGDSSSRQRRTRSPARFSRRANSRRPEVRKFRTKVHAPDDIRYIIIGPTIEYAEFETRIREKFGFQHPLKIKVQDDGDMITMVDQEDLDLLLGSAREIAQREGSEMGKMEVCLIFHLKRTRFIG